MRAIILILLFSAIASAADDNVRSLIDSGDFEAAYQSLLESPESSTRNEEIYYLLGASAPVGNDAAQYLKEYLQKFPNGSHERAVRSLLADYYAASGLYITASTLYPGEERMDIADPEALYRIALARQQAGEYNRAMDIYRRLASGRDSVMSVWAEAGLGDCQFLAGAIDSATEIYDGIIENDPDSPCLPFALLSIAESFRVQGHLDKAGYYYALLKRRFPDSPGSDELEAALSEYQGKLPQKQIPGSIKVDYYIQVGVFGKRDNAKICHRKFRNLGYNVRLDEFDEGGQKFFRVLLGPFDKESVAQKKKNDLEKSEGEKFLIFIK